MNRQAKKTPIEIPALKVRQWLKSWDEIAFDPKVNQAKPPPPFLSLLNKTCTSKGTDRRLSSFRESGHSEGKRPERATRTRGGEVIHNPRLRQVWISVV
jgi:hypothetical protein